MKTEHRLVTIDVLEKFAKRFTIAPNGCWVSNTVYGHGYGLFSHKKTFRAHRFIYEVIVGLIPEGLVIDHLCRNRGCVNPKHLEAVTQQVNTLRGKSFAAEYAKRTHCNNGHPLEGDNLYITKNRYGRACRTCFREYRRRNHKPLLKKDNLSDCGCPMCAFHSEARQLNQDRTEANE